MAITVMLEFSVLVERAEEFKILLRELLPDTRSYEGCLRVDVYCLLYTSDAADE